MDLNIRKMTNHPPSPVGCAKNYDEQNNSRKSKNIYFNKMIR